MRCGMAAKEEEEEEEEGEEEEEEKEEVLQTLRLGIVASEVVLTANYVSRRIMPNYVLR